MAPTYLRIVAEIEERVRSGDLAPGNRVPSTRQISKDFGVAIATATKVLAELASRGVVSAIPGVGTVVAAQATAVPRPASRPASRPVPRPVPGHPTRATSRQSVAKQPESVSVSRERIIAAAIEIADSEGIGAVTMRRLAVDLGVATMSLYHWVSSKDDLVVGMIDTLMGADTWPAVPPQGWRAQLEFVARRQWRGYLAHPWLAQVVSLTRPQLAPGAMMHTEWVLRALAPYRLSSMDQMYAVLTLFGHVKSVATGLEQERQAERDTGLDIEEWFAQHDDEFTPVIQSGRFPALAALDGVEGEFEFDLATQFEFGLTLLLDGLAAKLHTSHDD